MSLPMLKSVGSLQQYKNYACQFPVLSVEEERELFRKYHLGDDSVVSTIILHNLRYVLQVVYNDFNVLDTSESMQADLIQEGNIGLIESIPRYNPDFNVRFVTYAGYQIKHRIVDFIKNNRMLVKTLTTKALSKLHNNYDKIERSKLVESLNVTEEDVKTFEQARTVSFHSINELVDGEENEVANTLSSGVSILDELLQEEYHGYVKKVHDALSQLDDRRREIFVARCLTDNPTGLKELACHYRISVERVRQLEIQATKKISMILGIPDRQ